MDKSEAKIGLVVGGIIVLAFVAYTLLKKPANQNPTGGGIAYGYDPSGGVSISNVGGSNGTNGTLLGNNIANTYGSNTPIVAGPTAGSAVNAITGQIVDPSSWQGTTNNSGAITYLNGELGGEGSSTLALQSVTY